MALSITPLPTAPQRSDPPATFNTLADAWVDAIDLWTTEVNAITIDIEADVTAADASAIAAAASETAAGISETNAVAAAASAATSASTAASFVGTAIAPEVFNGTGAQTVYTLVGTPETKDVTQIFIDGVYQQKSQYTLVGNTLTFTVAPALGTNNVEVIIQNGLISGGFNTSATTDPDANDDSAGTGGNGAYGVGGRWVNTTSDEEFVILDSTPTAAVWKSTTSTSVNDVVGPASATDNAICRYDLTTGKLIQNSVMLVGDTGIITGATWGATAIGPTFGGTGQVAYATGDILYASATNTLSKLAVGSDTDILTLAGGVPTWAAAAAGGGLFSENANGSIVGGTGAGAALSGDADNFIAGGNAAANATSLSDSIVIGYGAVGTGVAVGANNVVVGASAALTLSSSSGSVILGAEAAQAIDSERMIAIGYRAGRDITANTNTIIGYQAAYLATGISNSVIIGDLALQGAATTGGSNVLIGAGAGVALAGNVNLNTIIGASAGASLVAAQMATHYGYKAGYKTTSANNMGIGSFSCSGLSTALLTGGNNTCVGYLAGAGLTGGVTHHTIVGTQAGSALTSYDTTIMGSAALYLATTGCDGAVVMGHFAGSNATGIGNSVMIGQYAGQYAAGNAGSVLVGRSSGASITGDNNTFLGAYSGRVATGMNHSVVIGYYAVGTGVCIQPDNVVVGAGAGLNLSSGAGLNVLLGHDAGADLTTATQILRIANATGTGLINGDFANDNVGLSTVDFSDMVGGMAIEEGTTAPTASATTAGLLYVESGALKYRGPGGTVTTLGVT